MARWVEPVVITPDAVFLVPERSVVCPAVPELETDVHELGGASVTFCVRRQLRQVEVLGRVDPRRGHDVPACTPLAHVVEGAEAPGQVVGFVVGGRCRGDEADVPSDGGERREQQGRLEGARRPLTDVGPEHRAVRQKQGVELAALRDAREVLVVLDVRAGEWVALRQTPGGLMVADAEEESVEVELAAALGHIATPLYETEPPFVERFGSGAC
jgi:hypothetical protein